jgi:hypothetical protein
MGLLSSLLLEWGYSPPRGIAQWTTGDGAQAARSKSFLKKVAVVGFLLLALSYDIKTYVIVTN